MLFVFLLHDLFVCLLVYLFVLIGLHGLLVFVLGDRTLCTYLPHAFWVPRARARARTRTRTRAILE